MANTMMSSCCSVRSMAAASGGCQTPSMATRRLTREEEEERQHDDKIIAKMKRTYSAIDYVASRPITGMTIMATTMVHPFYVPHGRSRGGENEVKTEEKEKKAVRLVDISVCG